MSLLTICQEVLEEVGGFEVPATIVGNPNGTARQILRIAQRAGKNLARYRPWTDLTEEKTFTATTGQAIQTGAIPADFWYFRNFTWWDRTNFWRLRGPATANQWQTLNSGIVSQTARKWIRIRGGDLLLYPNPGSADTIAFEFVSKYWVDTNGDGVGEAFAWAADSDTAIIDEDLIQLDVHWRFLKSKGMPYMEEYEDWKMQRDLVAGRDGGHGPIYMSVRDETYLIGPDSIPDTGFGS